MAEEKRSVWRKVGQFLLDIPEKYVSSIAFTTLFRRLSCCRSSSATCSTVR